MLTQVSTLSTQYIKVNVSKDDGTDPTSDLCFMCLKPQGVSPVNGDMCDAAWQIINGLFFITLLVGPGTCGQVTTPGIYDVWVKITDSPEIPVQKVDRIQFF